MNWKALTKTAKRTLSRNSSKILLGLGIAGAFTAVGFAITATPKAMILLEEKKQELELRKKSPVPTEDRAKELVQRFMDSAFASRELLVSLIDRIELTEEKQVIIKFRFAELDEVG